MVKPQKTEETPVVEPLETATEAPTAPEAPEVPAVSAEPEVDITDDITLPNGDIDDTRCWNCKRHLNSDNVCDNCGFDRNLVSNIRLEAKINKGEA